MVLWFSPVCDQLLQIVTRWLANYEQGEVYSTRKWLSHQGTVVDRPTRYAHRLALRTNEVKRLLTIMQALSPTSPIILEIAALDANLRKGQLLPGGRYSVTIAYYQQDVQEIYDTLIRAQAGETGPLEVPRPDGKERFEV